MRKENIPNLITLMRFVGTLALLFCEPLSICFFVVYVFCGITDVLDGFLARKLNATSVLGARLDSAADLTFYITMAIKIFPLLLRKLSIEIWCAIGGILLVRLVCYTTAYIKFKCFASLHTYMNKATGLMVYLMPYAIISPFFGVYQYAAVCIAMLAAVEELLIHVITKDYHTDVKCLLLVKRQQRQA